jgi:hypothetical protein
MLDGAVADGTGSGCFLAMSDGLAAAGVMPREVAFATAELFLAGLPLDS